MISNYVNHIRIIFIYLKSSVFGRTLYSITSRCILETIYVHTLYFHDGWY